MAVQLRQEQEEDEYFKALREWEAIARDPLKSAVGAVCGGQMACTNVHCARAKRRKHVRIHAYTRALFTIHMFACGFATGQRGSLVLGSIGRVYHFAAKCIFKGWASRQAGMVAFF